MAVQSTLLSTIINRMKRWQALAATEDQHLIRDLDEAIRTFRRDIQLPWLLQKGTLRVFHDVLEYPIPADYDELGYIDHSKEGQYADRMRGVYTSLQQFYEDVDYRNDVAEIRDGNQTFLGVRLNTLNLTSQLLNNAEDSDDFTASGDASAITEEGVVYKKGNGSIKFTVTNSSGSAIVKNTFNSFTDANYKQKYHFKWVYLDAVPTSIALRFQVDDSNYLETTGITTQFSGQPLRADDWNLVAQDLNTATAVGTISDSSVWASEKIILTGAATGTYYVDQSDLRKWEPIDLWYYSRYSVALVGSTTANQEYFFNASEVYSTDSSLIGDLEWIDCVQYDAMTLALVDRKEWETLTEIKARNKDAHDKLFANYPSMKPLIITKKFRMQTDFNSYDDSYQN